MVFEKIQLLAIVGLLLFFPPLAHAQVGCPPGYYPIGGGSAGWNSCAPMGSVGQPPPDPGPRWATRWGAIAVDNGRSAWGYADGAFTKKRASKAAVGACKKNGGKKCKIYIAYYNQCGALASGYDRITSYRAPESGQAEAGAVDLCSEETEGCSVVHSGCSYPELID